MNPDGNMILAANRYDTSEEAETGSRKDAPTDPSHTGYVFTGWAVNVDEFGDYILVAKYNEIPEDEKKLLFIGNNGTRSVMHLHHRSRR